MFPIDTVENLPPVGTSSESPELDFKQTVNPSDSIEMAKDVAALANTAGGSIIVGADTQGQRLTACPGIPENLARQAGEGYETAVKDRCRPTPYLETRVLPANGGSYILVVNVWLSPVAPVGVRIRQQPPYPVRLLDEAWVFPRRVGSQTSYLQPDQFGAFENMTARRATALLLRIPEDERKAIRIRWSVPNQQFAATTQSPFQGAGHLLEVSLDRNFAHFLLGNARGEDLKPLLVPLDWIHTVWRDNRYNEWQVIVDAVLRVEGDCYVPYQRVS